MDRQVSIGFPDETANQAGLSAESLAADIKRALPGMKVDVKRSDPSAMDFGATIVLILGAPAAVILAKAIRDWAIRRGRGTISLDGVRIDGVDSADMAKIIEALQKTSEQ